FYEVPNLLLNGTLRALLQERPQLKTLLVHNVDTLGAFADPAILGTHLQSGRGITLEVIGRQLADKGGGLARVDGKLRLVEGLAMPESYSEYGLSYFNSMTSWVDLDQYLSLLGLDRESVLINDRERIGKAIGNLVERMPTYLTIKEVKRRARNGQEGAFPVAQIEHLWGDLTTLPDSNCGYLLVDRQRGRQLKSPDELDEWVAQSAAHLQGLCAWG
ncbi:MAG TPA: UTP--glucose-1-phosphate uridylyltransferase, partial [Verrucomicrobiales bacterium]|nr:UTP--glucose-1-phosphate uridylyltransferase [Verrucomicrobiales bacterium]